MGVQMDKTFRLNFGTFNIPTIIAVAGVLWWTATKQERQDARLDTFDVYINTREKERTLRSAEINKMLETLTTKTSPIENLTYRITVTEQGIADVNRRVDRVGDSMQNIRDDVGSLSSKIDVLTEQVKAAFPKKAELDNTPPKLTQR